jgi:hypothetical protein
MGAGWCKDEGSAHPSASISHHPRKQPATSARSRGRSSSKGSGAARGERWPRRARRGQGPRGRLAVRRRGTWCRYPWIGRWVSACPAGWRGGMRQGPWTRAPAACLSWAGSGSAGAPKRTRPPPREGSDGALTWRHWGGRGQHRRHRRTIERWESICKTCR